MVALFLTIWIALVLFVVAEAGKGPLAAAGARPARWAWQASSIGVILLVIHTLLAFATRYGWTHEVAVQETANQAAALYGFAWRGSIYVNYAFILAWFADAGRPRERSLGSTESRDRLIWIWRTFAFVMIVNAAVVFARPGWRVLGGVLVAALIWTWLPRSRAVAA